jgi:hypothetical protein
MFPMRKAFAGLFVMTMALALAVPAFAEDVETVARPNTEARTPNFLGATGLLYTPTAYTQHEANGSLYLSGNSDFFGGGATYGITDRLEVGFGVLDFDDDLGGDTEILANAKFQLLKETNQLPALSVGVIDAFDQLDLDPSWYIVASKFFTRANTDADFALKGHVGFGGGLYDEEVFAGAELLWSNNISLLAEFINSDFNVGGRYHYKGWTATIGWFDFKHVGGQIAYNIALKH